MRFFFFLNFLFYSFFINAQTSIINDSTEFIKLDKHTYYYKTSNDSFNINDLATVKWQKSNKGGNFGLVKDIFWLKYEFNNISDNEKELYLFFPYNYVNNLDVYQEINGEFTLLSELGTERNILNNGRVSRGWVTKINFPQQKSIIIVKAKNLYAPLRVNSFLLKEKLLDQTIVNSYNIIWIWKGVFIFIILMSLVLYYFLKFKLFLYFFLFNLGVFFSLGVDFGDLNFLFRENSNNWAIDIQRMANFLGLFFFPLFLNQLTPIKKYNPRIWKLISVGYVIFCLFWVFNLFGIVKNSKFYLYSNYYFTSFSFFIILIHFYFLFRAFLDNEKNSKVLLLLYTVFISSITFYGFSQMLGISKDGLYVYNAILLSTLLPVLTFLFLITYDLSIIISERNLLIQKQNIHEVELIKAVVESQESERNIVGRELHDMIGANLAVIKQKTNKSDFKLVRLIDDTIDTIRSLSHGLITPNIEYSNIEEEIQDLLSMFETDDMKVKYYFHEWPIIKNKNFGTHLYRIIQELLQNALKHSEATEVYIQFLNHDSNLSIMYEDNGKGFNVNNRSKSARGLYNVENRVSLIGGIIHFDSTNTGTSINIEFKNL